MPSVTVSDFIYAALLYKDDEFHANPESKDFVQGETADGEKLIFSFQRPDDTRGTFTLEICAFTKTEDEADENAMQFFREKSLLSGVKAGCKIEGNKIEVNETIPLVISSSEPGTVSLQIKVPAGCSLEIDDTANFDCEKSGDTYTVSASGISAGAYQIEFTVKKDAEIIHIFSEYINVLHGMCTDTWSGLEKDEAKDIANVISKTVYVRGTGGWYDEPTSNVTAMASDGNSGSFLSPLATIQKAVDTIIARNDGTSEYTIYVDGTLTQSTTITSMAHIAPDTNLNLKIESMSASATLDAANNGRVMSIVSSEGGIPTVTLKNIHITGGYFDGLGGGIYFSGGSLTMVGCKITECTALNGGGIYNDSGELELTNVIITDCKAKLIYENSGGGGIYNTGTLNITGGTISSCTSATDGGGIFVNDGILTMTGGTISSCTATNQGGGVYIASVGAFNMSGTAEITGCKTTSTDSNTGGGGIYSKGKLSITGGTISKCTSANYGGGVVANGGTFIMSGGTKISGNKAKTGGAVCIRAGTFTMKGGTIGGENEEDGNTAVSCGGVYAGIGTFRMEGGTITGNNSYGVYINGGYFYMSDMAKVESNNIVYGNGSNPIYISGALKATTPVATFNLGAYGVDRTVLRADTDTNVSIDEDICNKIALTAEGCKIVPSEDGTKGVLKVHTIFLNSENGKDYLSGVSTSNAAKTLSKAIEKYDTYNAEKIMVCAPYTLPIGESTLLNRTGKEHLTLMRYGGASDGSGALTGNLLTISQGNVGIFNTTLDGNKENVNAEGSLLYISGSTTTVTLGTDATLCNNRSKTTKEGGAVYISEGIFEMTDGTITGNFAGHGGGVRVVSGGTFKMSEGEISNNSANFGGGVNASNSNFTMTGGKIMNNDASYGGGVVFSGGVTFNMSDGEITGNTAATKNGIYAINTNTITQTGGTVQSD